MSPVACPSKGKASSKRVATVQLQLFAAGKKNRSITVISNFQKMSGIELASLWDADTAGRGPASYSTAPAPKASILVARPKTHSDFLTCNMSLGNKQILQ